MVMLLCSVNNISHTNILICDVYYITIVSCQSISANKCLAAVIFWSACGVVVETPLSCHTLSQFAAEAEHQKGEMREIVHLQAGQCGNQIGAKVGTIFIKLKFTDFNRFWLKHHFFIKQNQGIFYRKSSILTWISSFVVCYYLVNRNFTMTINASTFLMDNEIFYESFSYFPS